MNKLVSEQLPNDGGYHIKRLVNEANARLKKIGRQGKRATIAEKRGSLTLQFTFKDGDIRSQKNVGIGGIPASPKGIEEAEKIAQLVTGQLVAGMFTWDWYKKLIGTDTSEQTKQLTCKEMVEQYKEHYFKQRKDNKSAKSSWYLTCGAIEKVLGNLEKPLSLPLIRETVESKENNSVIRSRVLSGLVGFLKYSGNNDYKDVIKDYKASNNPKPKKRNVPSDEQLVQVYENGFKPGARTSKRWLYRYPQWQFLYGLLATYGLRVHEAWHIANWDKPVTLKDGDWLTVDIGDDNNIKLQRSRGNLVIPAILDPNNSKYILCIKHDTKTGYRMTIPISPESHNWLEEFNLLQPLNLPDMKNPLKRIGKDETSFSCTRNTCDWFNRHEYGFNPHDLRHAFNHRGHHLGYNPKVLADSLGHSIQMNSNNYLRHMNDSVKLEGMIDDISRQQERRSRVEILEAENEVLKAENKDLKSKIELLEMKLQLNEAYRESEAQK